MAKDDVAEYNEAQFESAYRALIQCSHAIRHIEVGEIQRWVEKKLRETPPTVENAEDGIKRIRTLLQAFYELREVMKTTGVPRTPPLAQPLPDKESH